eukprot:CAMPEP_0198301688 /NCGR_PEP_ID=MMETSP1449-20131203/52534_1 /TAXON_ID=420275 /ORGANISM="Attheya septentrionalis, Strain CCMP2084" /LENGTH=77 /DNA_ID=CAMNT_0044003823 /DNA_START=35 /DNA_END=268 /DNA_ORIENTATION=+
MASPAKIELSSCPLVGHLFCRGNAVKKELHKKYPEAEIEHKLGGPFMFTVKKDNEKVDKASGARQLFKSAKTVADEV